MPEDPKKQQTTEQDMKEIAGGVPLGYYVVKSADSGPDDQLPTPPGDTPTIGDDATPE